MSDIKLSRRNFLRATAGIAGAAALAAGCKGGAPAVVKSPGDLDLSKPENVKKALEAEGAAVTWTTWGFEGLVNQVIPARFALYTQQKYGVPVVLTKINQDIGKAMTELPVAGKHINTLGIDVVDNEEEYTPRWMALEWGEPLDREQYKPLIPNILKTEAAYLYRAQPKVDGGDIYGVMYQGFEWLQALLRKDKVDVKNYNDWTDLSRAELKGKGVLYPFNDSRGQFVFMGILNSLIKQGIVKGELWSEAAWEAGIKWWKDNLEDKIWKWGDIGNNMDLRANLQAGEVWWAGTWGVYTRAILATDWNQKDNVIAGFYPKSGIAADREKCKVVKGCKTPRRRAHSQRLDGHQRLSARRVVSGQARRRRYQPLEHHQGAVSGALLRRRDEGAPRGDAGMGQGLLSAGSRQPDPGGQLGLVVIQDRVDLQDL